MMKRNTALVFGSLAAMAVIGLSACAGMSLAQQPGPAAGGADRKSVV
jgi:hypothetical protein